MTNTNVAVIMAFDTNNEYNQLSQAEKFQLVNSLTDMFGGVTLTEHFGGYRMDDGTNAVEYSYTLELFGVDNDKALTVFKDLASRNSQESIIYNGDFIYTNQKA